MIGIFVGILSGFVIISAGKITRFEKDASFYPLILIVIALLYVLFAQMDQGLFVILAETGVALLFVAMAIAGHKINDWWTIIGFASHGLYDFFHPALLNNAGVPDWWPGFCLGIDEVIAGYLLFKVMKKSRNSKLA